MATEPKHPKKSRAAPPAGMSEGRFDDELTQQWLNGIRQGWEQVAAQLRRKAGDAFAGGQDAKATALRELAEWAEAEATERAAAAMKHQQEHLPEEKRP